MKLDKRIIKGKRPLDCVDVDIAKTYIGQKGYFANCLCAFQDLKSIDYHLTYATLKEVNSQRPMAFADDFDGDEFSYFLPEEWVKEPEKKWRPFSLTEWRHEYGVGYGITFRIKNSDTSRMCLCCGLFSDHDDDLPGKGVINLGGELFALQNLFEKFELRETDEWRPFGMEEE